VAIRGAQPLTLAKAAAIRVGGGNQYSFIMASIPFDRTLSP